MRRQVSADPARVLGPAGLRVRTDLPTPGPTPDPVLVPMGPMMGKPQSIGGGIGQPDQGGGIGNIQLIASLHRMGLM